MARPPLMAFAGVQLLSEYAWTFNVPKESAIPLLEEPGTNVAFLYPLESATHLSRRTALTAEGPFVLPHDES